MQDPDFGELFLAKSLALLRSMPGRIHSAREWANEESLTIAIAAHHCIA
jgi:hypothetical protein